jgi:hypothetical protein
MFQAAAEGNSQMGEVAANAAALGICFICGSGDARVLVAEDQVIVHEVADSLHARPAQRCVTEEAPRIVGQAIGLAIATAGRFRRQMLYIVLKSVQIDRIGSQGKFSRGCSKAHQLPKLSR